MKRVRLLQVSLATLVTPLLALSLAGRAAGQNVGLQISPRPTRGKPFLGGPLPREVVRVPRKASRAAGVTAQTVDITPNTATVTDQRPFWTIDERYIYFTSNRTNLSGTTVGALNHIYRMLPDGSGVTAITGPLSTGSLGATTNQSAAALNSGSNRMVYIQTTAGGSVDLIELNLDTRATKSLTAGNPSGFTYTGLNHPEYAAWPGTNIAVVFAGRIGVGDPYKLYVVDTGSGVITQVTTGASDDQNPTLSPSQGTTQTSAIIAFDSNRSVADGSGTKATRDVWVIPMVPGVAATRVTNFSAGGAASSNEFPAWSTNKLDPASSLIDGQQLLAFASTRIDSAGDGNADGVNPNGTHDIYWLKTRIGLAPSGTTYTVLTPETAANKALKLITGDPGHLYDDIRPTFPQFVNTYRIAYQTNRTAFDEPSGVSLPPSPLATTPTDIFTSDLLDYNAPALVRYDETSGEIMHIEPRLAAPGSTVTFTAKLSDLESGIRDVYLQIKNPNSRYQSSDGKEHKVFLTVDLPLDGTTTALAVPVEYESQRIFVGSNPADSRVGSYGDPKYIASVDDYYAYSGGASAPDAGWLKMSLVSRDSTTGISTYSASWTADSWSSDYFVDLIAYDNAVDPFGSGSNNWRIYDNIWGFSTQSFAPSHGLLFVSDNAAGQKFFGSRFGRSSLVNVSHTFWGTESWMTDIKVSLLPTQYQQGTTIGPLANVLNTLGAKSYSDSRTSDGTVVDGVSVPVTQQYDIWRVLSRGPVTDSVLSQYLPHVDSQPADVINGETAPRVVTVRPRAVLWHAPYVGNLFVGPGSVGDMAVQVQLDSFVKSGGRLFVNGEDIGWALTLDGATGSTFMANTLKATYVRDDVGFTFFRIGGGGGFLGYGISGAYGLTPTGSYDPISHDPWNGVGGVYVSTFHHTYPGPNTTEDYIDTAPPRYLVGGTDPTQPHMYGAPVAYPDGVTAATGTQVDLAYGTGQSAFHHYVDTATGGAVAYCAMGLEGLFPDFYAVPNSGTPGVIALKNRRAELVHNMVCFFRTGTVIGSVLDVDGAGNPLANVLVRLSNKATGSGTPVTAYTALTAEDGSFLINGVEPYSYEVTAYKPGYTIQKRTLVVTHGGGRDNISFRMTVAEPAVVQGKVTRADGTTPVVGATLTLTDVMPPNAVLTATTDAQGAYSISRVPAQTKYTLTCKADGFGASTPVDYSVPNPKDPIATQQDTVVQPSKVYAGFDFTMKPEQGSATGRVLAKADNSAIANAVVTATLGTTVLTAVTDASGKYSFSAANSTPNGLDPGVWSFVATAPGYKASTAIQVTVVTKANTVADDILLETTPPGSISGLVTRSSDSKPLPGVPVQVRDSVGNLIATGTTVASTTDSTGYQYNYKMLNVPAGVTYTVTATLTGYTTVPTSRSAAVTTQVETKNINFSLEPLHTFGSALSLMSVPYDYSGTDAGDLLDIPTTDRTNGSFLLATWELKKYTLYPAPSVSQFRVGQGYWMAYRNNIPLSTEGGKADATRPFSVPVNNGWNLIGDPFLVDMDWTKISVIDGGVTKTFGQAVADGAIASALYGYVSGTYVLDYKLSPWKGYWVRAYRSVTILLDPVNGVYGRAAGRAAGRAVLGAGSGWSLNFRATAGTLRDTDNYIGVSSTASNGFDGFKVEKPPAFGTQYVRVTSEHQDWAELSGGYGVDVRAAGAGVRTWQMAIETSNAAGTVSVSWPNAASLPKNVSLTLTDTATGAVRDMRSVSDYSWVAGDGVSVRKLQVTAAVAGRNALRITDLAARQVSRASGVNLTFGLSSAADVDVRIMGATGKVVRRLTVGATRAAGSHQLTWDQKNDSGTAIPAGMYTVEVKARSTETGTVVRAVLPLVVTR